MSKPIIEVVATTRNKKSVRVPALFDTGAYFTFIRQDVLPKGSPIIRYTTPMRFKTAGKQGGVQVIGETSLIVSIGKNLIDARVRIARDLNREFLIGAETMQAWDISVKNTNGKTRVTVGLDLRDPEITELD